MHGLKWILTSLVAICYAATPATAEALEFVKKYAPLLYLDENELYFPSDIASQLTNTSPTLNFTALGVTPTLNNLDQLNSAGNCTLENFGSCPIYLTSNDDITTNPQWLYGVFPDPTSHETAGAKSAAIIVNDHGDGIVDAFYMFFYAYNLGLTAGDQVLGNHVGDWEHNMIRFRNGTPISMWYSQHDSGQAFAWDAISKNGTRPIVYSAIGSHANFAVPGTHSRVLGPFTVNDYTSAGALWDPTLSAYYYSYQPTSEDNGTFTSLEADAPVAWLHFLGRWGDKQYLDSDPRQLNFLNVSIAYRFESGPTGPLDKVLNRTETCPNANNCTTLSVLPATSGSTIPVTVSRTSSATSTPTALRSQSSISSTAGAASSRSTNIAVTGLGILVALGLF